MSGLMVALSLIGWLVCWVFLLISLFLAGIIGVGAMLIRFAPVGDPQCCQGFCSVPRPLQSVQRAEMWGVILALQSSGAVHLGVDNLSVVRHVGRLLDGRRGPTLFELGCFI